MQLEETYNYLQKQLERLGRENWRNARYWAQNKKLTTLAPRPTRDMENIVQALNTRDERQLMYLEKKFKRMTNDRYNK